MSKFNLLDSFEAHGKSFKEFTETLAEIDSCTSVVKTDMTDITFFSVQETDDDGALVYRVIDAAQTIAGTKLPDYKKNTISKLLESGIPMEIIEETKTKTKLFTMFNKRGYFVSRNLFEGISARAELSGLGVYEPCDELFSLLMRRYVDHMPEGTFIVRSKGSAKKLMACFSKQYHYVPQSLLCDIIAQFKESLGKPVCSKWEITQFHTNIYVEFPEVADDLSKTYKLNDVFMPGVLLCTSDTGDSSIKAIGTMRFRKSVMLTEEFTRKHSGDIDLPKLLTSIDKTVFQNYTKLPERLCELMTIDIHDPAECTENILEQIGLEDCVGKRIARKLVEEMGYEFNPGIKYTGYDIAANIMELPGRYIDGTDSTIRKLAGLVPKAVFANYEKANKPITVTLSS